MLAVACERLRVRELFFFFSSRRRHTRSLCDWSSRVLFRSRRDEDAPHEVKRCHPASSARPSRRVATLNLMWRILIAAFCFAAFSIGGIALSFLLFPLFRSEERRVGKECSIWWSAVE